MWTLRQVTVEIQEGLLEEVAHLPKFKGWVEVLRSAT